MAIDMPCKLCADDLLVKGFLYMSEVFQWQEKDLQRLIDNCPDEPVTPYIYHYFAPGSTLLESGCGSGRFVYYLASKGFDITGLELGGETVHMLNQIFPNLDIRQGDVSALPFLDDHFDGILSLGVIEHIPEGTELSVAEMFRVLKTGGYALVIVPSWNLIRRIKYLTGIYHLHALLAMIGRNPSIRAFFRKPPLIRNGEYNVNYRREFRRWPVFGDFFEYRYTPQQFESMLQNAGFTLIESVPVSLIDGIYHEFGRCLVPLRDHRFYPGILGKLLNRVLSDIPFCHNHMHLCVVRK